MTKSAIGRDIKRFLALDTSMTVWVEYNENFDEWEISQAGGVGVLTTAQSRQTAVKKGRRYADRGEDVAVKGPRMSSFKNVK
jgi:hypothetical protein